MWKLWRLTYYESLGVCLATLTLAGTGRHPGVRGFILCPSVRARDIFCFVRRQRSSSVRRRSVSAEVPASEDMWGPCAGQLVTSVLAHRVNSSGQWNILLRNNDTWSLTSKDPSIERCLVYLFCRLSKLCKPQKFINERSRLWYARTQLGWGCGKIHFINRKDAHSKNRPKYLQWVLTLFKNSEKVSIFTI